MFGGRNGTGAGGLVLLNQHGDLGLVPAHFALMIIVVVHVVGHWLVLTGTCRGRESMGVMLGSSGV